MKTKIKYSPNFDPKKRKKTWRFFAEINTRVCILARFIKRAFRSWLLIKFFVRSVCVLVEETDVKYSKEKQKEVFFLYFFLFCKCACAR